MDKYYKLLIANNKLFTSQKAAIINFGRYDDPGHIFEIYEGHHNEE